jgi:hemoglobin
MTSSALLARNHSTRARAASEAKPWFCQSTPITQANTGRDMRATHEGMGVTAGEFDALDEDLVATLDEFNVPKPEQDDLLGLVAPMRSAIVEVESAETETPLPEGYQAAPALS